ncbi:DNA polymerase III subunit delta [Borrelia sp. BU AG58]|uniref:DNA polymerase III subunit delta n=1 Tax=Borrelia sp. BU AG58 TaxID=2887345 RepID=UPI001E3D1A6A|nr:DNA polymerase III subunit delta [Borrelia sp. BU AG58]UER67629.1 DNA polymerase III subunit delta [Borrelia sp. BU AG58]
MREVYLLLGKEQGLKEVYLNGILSKLGALHSDLLVSKIFLSDLSSVELSELLSTNSFFAREEVFIVYEAESLKNKKELGLIYSTIEKSLNKTVILVSDENSISFDPKDSLRLIKKTFYELSNSDRFLFVKKTFFELGMKVTDKAINLMLFMLDSDTKTLKFYINSLSLLVKDRTINESDVKSWIGYIRPENSFSLFESLLKREMESSLIKMKSILDQGEDFVSVLMSLGWQFRKLLKIKVDFQGSVSISSVFKKHKIFASLEGIYKTGLKNYSYFDIKFILKVFHKFDLYSRIYSKNLHLNLAYFMVCILLRQEETILNNFSSKFKYNF